MRLQPQIRCQKETVLELHHKMIVKRALQQKHASRKFRWRNQTRLIFRQMKTNLTDGTTGQCEILLLKGQRLVKTSKTNIAVDQRRSKQ